MLARRFSAEVDAFLLQCRDFVCCCIGLKSKIFEGSKKVVGLAQAKQCKQPNIRCKMQQFPTNTSTNSKVSILTCSSRVTPSKPPSYHHFQPIMPRQPLGEIFV